MKKILFLDHDGVICLSSEWGSRFKKKTKFDIFNSKAIKVLNEIIEKTDCDIVISSDWKLYASLEEMKELYLERGVKKTPIDYTPNLQDFDPLLSGLYFWKGWNEQQRILEIMKYLETNPEITHWVAVDDLNMSEESNNGNGLKNFVLTRASSEGIKQKGIKEKIIKILNS